MLHDDPGAGPSAASARWAMNGAGRGHEPDESQDDEGAEHGRPRRVSRSGGSRRPRTTRDADRAGLRRPDEPKVRRARALPQGGARRRWGGSPGSSWSSGPPGRTGVRFERLIDVLPPPSDTLQKRSNRCLKVSGDRPSVRSRAQARICSDERRRRHGQGRRDAADTGTGGTATARGAAGPRAPVPPRAPTAAVVRTLPDGPAGRRRA